MHPAVSMICGLATRACFAMCLYVSTIIIEFVCYSNLCGFLPWMDHCFGHHISSLLAHLSFVDHCFGCLFCPFSARPFPALRHQVSPIKFLQSYGARWWPLAGLVVTHRVAMEPSCCAWYLCGRPTNL